jgi:hypothetical protein
MTPSARRARSPSEEATAHAGTMSRLRWRLPQIGRLLDVRLPVGRDAIVSLQADRLRAGEQRQG